MKKALVLSGGGSKGAAHVGVLRALHDRGFVPELIVGVSIGAVVGAAYAMLEDGMELWKGAIKVYSSSPKAFPFKIGSVSKPFNPIIANLGCRYMLMRKSVFPSSLYFNVFKKVFGNLSFEETGIEFHCASTDLETGALKLHSSGKIIDALLASISIPGIFPPIEYEDGFLIDGGTTCNLPCPVAKKLGADYVVAVDLCCPNDSVKPLTSNAIFSINGQISDSILNTIWTEDADLVIKPIKKHMDSLDFRKCIDLMKYVYRETLEMNLPRRLFQ